MKKLLQKMFPVLLFIILCLIFLFIYQQIILTKSAYKDIETEWSKEAQRRIGIKLLNNSFLKIENDKKILDEHFAQSSNIVPFLDTIEKLGKDVGVKVEVSSVSVSEKNKNLNIELKGVGNFESIYKFILLLENAPYELDFYSFEVKKNLNAQDLNKSTIWTTDLKMRLLSFVL